MDLLKRLTSKSYRVHRWARNHLAITRFLKGAGMDYREFWGRDKERHTNAEQLNFTTRVLGPAAAYRLEKRQVTQTLRSESSSITNAILLGQISAGEWLDVLLDSSLLGIAKLVSMDAVTWKSLTIEDATRGGFDNLVELEQALRRAGYRFKPLNEYHFYRIQFEWHTPKMHELAIDEVRKLWRSGEAMIKERIKQR